MKVRMNAWILGIALNSSAMFRFYYQLGPLLVPELWPKSRISHQRLVKQAICSAYQNVEDRFRPAYKCLDRLASSTEYTRHLRRLSWIEGRMLFNIQSFQSRHTIFKAFDKLINGFPQ
jgi:hypothetical protein